MEISKNSWHFKLNGAMQKSFNIEVMLGKTFTTCSYIWLTVFSIISLLMTITVFSVVAVFVLAIVSGMIGVPIVLAADLKFQSAIILHILGVGLIGWITLAFGTLVFCLVSLVNWLAESNTRRNTEKLKASLLNQAMKDRKDGVCTIVTFK